MRKHAIIATAAVCAAASLAAQRGTPTPPLVPANATVRVSDHVWVIPDGNVPMVPNVGIVVGSTATLVIDTGMGPRNAETVLREVAKVSPRPVAYLVTTHFHPEHAAGASLFTTATYVIPRVQQEDLDELGTRFIANFSRMSPAHESLLRDATVRRADTLFDREHTLSLGDISVRLMAVGPTHTRGDTIAFVEGDRVLFSGDVVMGRNVLSFSQQSSPAAWLKAFDTLEALSPRVIVPSHLEMGDASLIGQDRRLITSIQARVRDLKAAGQTSDQIASTVTAETSRALAGWANLNRVGGVVRAIVAEAP